MTTRSTKKSKLAPCPIVGIGASAGGLEAFRELLGYLPGDTGSAFVLIQHLDPTHASLLGSALGGATRMPVIEATDGLRVQPNCVYVIPPNTLMTLRKGALRLKPRGPRRKVPMAIDHFFHSLVVERGQRAIGVVLSGTASDGTLGLKAIKAAGGTTLAQEPATARYDGMPLSAVAAGVVDFVLPLDRMATKLMELGRRQGLPAFDGPRGLEAILRMLLGTTGVDFTQYKQTTILRRIARRVTARKLKGLSAYADFLRNDPAEVGLLYEDLFVHVTGFFRDPEVWKALKAKVFPEILKAKAPGTAFRIWVAACATGEEAYSIAISLLEFLGNRAREFPIQIFGSDISEQAIQRARAGVYRTTATRGLGQARLDRFFTKVEGGYRVAKAIRNMCVFVRHDLSGDPPFSRMDLISCRNTLIYFGPDLQKRVVPILHYALGQPGFLLLGHSETITGFGSLFLPADKKHKIYVRRPGAGRIGMAFSSGGRGAIPTTTPTGIVRTATSADAQREVDQLLLARFAPAGVVVDDDLNIVQFRGRTGPFLEPAPGQANLSLLKMARQGLLADLRLAAHAAKTSGLPVRREGVRLEGNGESRFVTIEVIPLRSGGGDNTGARQYAVLFEDAPAAAASPAKNTRKGGGKKGSKHDVSKSRNPEERKSWGLEQELAATREFLQSVIDQHATTNDELQTTNEELLSSNEELQSTNEELETAKEELQSANEELTTVNDELQIRNQELAQLGADLSNLLVSVDIPVLILDNARRIRRFTPSARNLLNLIPGDVGRSIHDIKLNIDIPDLERWLAEVTKAAVMKESEVRDHAGRWHRLQIRPYKTSDNVIDGVVLALMDIDTLRRSLEDARRARDFADGIVQTVQTPLLILDKDLRVQSANRAFCDAFHPPLPVAGLFLDALTVGPWRTPDIRVRIEKVLGDGDASALSNVETKCEIPDVGARDLVLNSGRIPSSSGGQPALLLAIEDVTERRLAESERARVASLEQDAQLAMKAAADTDVFLAVLSHELRTPLNSILLWAQLLQSNKVDSAKVARGIDTIARSARSQLMLINDLLDVSRIVSGKLRISLKPVALGQTVRDALEDLQPQADDKGVKVEISVDPDVGEVAADPDRLRQIFWNLMSNAVKFTPEGGLVRVSAQRTGANVRIEVSDTGIGIEPEFLPLVFDRFAQADKSATRAHGGLGLGLAIVAHLVDLHLGTIRASSPGPNQGATFTVTLPAITGERETGDEVSRLTRASAPGAIAERPNLEGLRVLLIDDDAASREAVGETLAGRGAGVEIAESVTDALAMLDRAYPDVIVCDMAMPGQGGYAFLRQLRARPPERGGSVPVCALTSQAAPEERRQALAAGFQQHLAKPVDAEDLALAVRDLARGAGGTVVANE